MSKQDDAGPEVREGVGPRGKVNPNAIPIKEGGVWNPVTRQIDYPVPGAAPETNVALERSASIVQEFKSRNFHLNEEQLKDCAAGFQILAQQKPDLTMEQLAAEIETAARQQYGQPPADRQAWERDREVERLQELERRRRGAQ